MVTNSPAGVELGLGPLGRWPIRSSTRQKREMIRSKGVMGWVLSLLFFLFPQRVDKTHPMALSTSTIGYLSMPNPSGQAEAGEKRIPAVGERLGSSSEIRGKLRSGWAWAR